MSDTFTRFTIGAVGHRDLGTFEFELRRTVSDALEHLVARHPRSACSVLTSLAEGADRLFVIAATELGLPYDCALPCAPDRFAEDFSTSESRMEFGRLLAGARSVLLPPLGFGKEDGYLWVSDTVLELSDCLVAVWDGEPGRGPAGTADTVARARLRSIPVIWIATDPPFPARALSPLE